MGIPSTIHAGATVKWTKSVSNDYSATDGFTLEYVLVSPDNKITVSGAVVTASGSDYTILIPAATTADYLPGKYTWHLYAYNSSTSTRYRLEGGEVTVAANVVALDELEGLDTRSHVKKVLDAIEGLLEGRMVDGIDAISVRGRSLQLMSITELVELRSHYQQLYRAELDAERVATGLSSRRKIRVRFT